MTRSEECFSPRNNGKGRRFLRAGVALAWSILSSLPLLFAVTVAFDDPSARTVPEDSTFTDACNITCANCNDANISLEAFNGTIWFLVHATGSITRNDTNPQVLGSVNGTVQTSFSLTAATASVDNALRCSLATDQGGAASDPKTITIQDTTPPIVTLTGPSNAALINRHVTFTYVPVDHHLANCSLFANWSGTWRAEQTTSTPQHGTTNSVGPLLLAIGTSTWTVACTDLAGQDATAPNATFTAAPDYALASITSSTAHPIEGTPVIFTAVIANKGNTTADVVVACWLGDPSNGTLVANTTVAVNGPNATTNCTSALPIGTTRVTVMIDAPNEYEEYDETNNDGTMTLNVSMWQTFAGNTSATVTLSINATFHQWPETPRGGNIYISDTDTNNGMQFLALIPFGRNASGETAPSTTDDFAQLDTALNTTDFTDSINQTFSTAVTQDFMLYGRSVTNVPTTSSNGSTTGLLWDASDGTAYNGTQDVIFVTTTTDSTYRIIIPARLKDYQGTTPAVTLYYEVT